MKKRMFDLENQIALQNANLNKISNNSNQKEEQLNNDITDYINQINELKNEMEVLNNIITNLTEEKENTAIKISSLLHQTLFHYVFPIAQINFYYTVNQMEF